MKTLDFPVVKPLLVVGIFFGAIAGFLFIRLLPLADWHPVFLLVVPFLCVLFLGVVREPTAVIAGLVLSRALLDPLLNLTKAENRLGFGAILNLVVILVTLFLILKNSPLLFKTAFFRYWIVFLLLCLASIAYSPAPLSAVKIFFNLVSYLCMAILPSVAHPERNDKKFWMKILFLSSLLPVTWAHWNLLKGGVATPDAGNRILGTFTHPNILAFYLVWVAALVLYILKSTSFQLSRLGRFCLYLYLADLLVLLVATKTRNAWIGGWLLFFLYGLFKERKFVFLSIAILLSGALFANVASRMADLFSSASYPVNSWAWRLEVWEGSLAWIRERWAFGYGLASFYELSRNFVTEKQAADAHNTYLQLWFETGLFGLAAYLLIFKNLLGALYRRCKKSFSNLSKEYAVALSYVVVYLVSGLADNMLYYLALNWYCWFFLGVILKSMQFQWLIRAEPLYLYKDAG